jgi:transposase
MTACGATMAKEKSWEITDDFWARVEPLIPVRERPTDQTYTRKTGGGRKPKAPRLVFEGIVYVLRTGCQWKALPTERYGSASTIHARFLQWEKAGFFEALWKAGLAEYDDLEGIAWRWQSIGGAMMKAPLSQSCVGPNPTDRGKKWQQVSFAGERLWRPVVARRDRSESA